MTFRIEIHDSNKIAAFANAASPLGRTMLFNAGAYALKVRVQRHLVGVAARRHATASRLGASPTGHYERGAAAVSSFSSPVDGGVVIPIAGVGRAWHDIDLATPTRRGKRLITIPCSRFSYGRTVAELRANGWVVFRPGKRKLLMGYRRGSEKKPIPLYTLAEGVHQPQEPQLLPSLAELSRVASSAMARRANDMIAKAKGNPT